MKIKFFIIIILFTILSNCKSSKVTKKNDKEVSIKISNEKDSLAFELCQIYGLDQGVRRSKSFPKKMKMIQVIDSFNFDRIINFIKKHGMPRREIIGKNYDRECVQMAFPVVMLHNPHRLVNEKKYFNLILSEVHKKRLSPSYFATILDKYYWIKSPSRDVMYGSQFGKPCLSHKKETNKLRIEIGLKPLKDNEFKQCK